MLTGGQRINQERLRQRQKGFDDAHDDEHGDGSLLHAAILLACDVAGLELKGVDPPDLNGPWPDQLCLHVRRKYAGDLAQRLTIAGALIAAEIDRIQRAANDS